jgi:sensor domain CHASE-containing protein
MSLRMRTLLGASGLVILLVMGLTLASSRLLIRSLNASDEAVARQEIHRAVHALAGEVDRIRIQTKDYGTWDDTYAFVADRNPLYVQCNLNPQTLRNLQINLIAYLDSAGTLIQASAVDADSGRAAPVPESVRALLCRTPSQFRFTVPGAFVRGIWVFPEGPMVLAGSPILTTKGEGPVRGTVLMGRWLDPSSVEEIGTAS